TALVIVARIAHLDGYWEVAPASRSRRSRSRRKSSGDWSVGGVVGRGFLVRTMVAGWLPSTNTSNSAEPSAKDSAAGIALPRLSIRTNRTPGGIGKLVMGRSFVASFIKSS